jgi:glyoxylase-like metal-dependent hydrolase (beta-lactamase superfamily II)
MQIGKFTIEQLSEGQFEFFPNGKINRRPVSERQKKTPKTANNSSLLGINPLYISDGIHHLLVDVGLGWGLDSGSEQKQVSNICTNLAIFDIAPADITHVLLTHLHYDHAAGATYTATQGRTCPTFPNARYVVQQSEWDFALQQVQHQSIHSTLYQLDDFYRLMADDYFHFIDASETEIIPGITLIKTGGHTPGHQIAKITDNGDTAYILGDLVPTAKQINHYDVSNRGFNRVIGKKMKTRLLRDAYQENACLYFYHNLSTKACKLQLDEEQNYVLKEC